MGAQLPFTDGIGTPDRNPKHFSGTVNYYQCYKDQFIRLFYYCDMIVLYAIVLQLCC